MRRSSFCLLIVFAVVTSNTHAFAQESEAGSAAKPSAGLTPAQVVEEPVNTDDPETLAGKASYILGYNTARKMVSDLTKQGIDVNPDQMLVGIQDALGGKQLAFAPEEIRSILIAYQKQLQAKRIEAMSKAAEENRVSGDAFRKENANKEGVVVLDNGIQYEVLAAGEGEVLAPADTVLVDYTGKFTDGTVFDSSLTPKGNRTPAPYPMAVSGEGVIPGLGVVLKMMKVGSKWRITIPPELAYQVTGSGPIGPNETLVFEIDVKKKVEKPSESK